MTSAAVLSVVVRANTAQANSALAATEGQMKKLGATSAATTGTMGARASALGATLTKAVTVPVAAVGGAAIAMSMDFNKAMRLVQTQAGASAAEVAHMKREILDFAASGKTTATPKELATALYRVESAGYRGAKAMEVLKASTELSEIAQSDLEGTTNAVVAAQKTQIKGTGSLQKTIGTLNAIVGAGNLRMDDLTSAMGTGFLTNAKQMGLTLKQAGAALATLTVQGQPAAASATRLSMAWRMMMAPTDQAADALHSIGLETDTLGKMMQAHQFPQAVGLLADKLDALGHSPAALQQKASVIRDIFGARSAVGISAILNGLDDYNQRLDQIGRTGDKVDESLKTIQETPGFKLNAALSQLSAALIKLGDVLAPIIIPALVKLVDLLATVAGGFADLPQPVRTLGLVLIGLAAAAGPVLKLVGAVLKLQLALRGLAAAEALAGGAGIVGGGTAAAAGGATAAGGAVGAAEIGGGGAVAGGTLARLFGGAGKGAGVLGKVGRVGGRVALPVAIVLTGIDEIHGFNRALKISKDASSADLEVRLKARIEQEKSGGPFSLSGGGIPGLDQAASGLSAGLNAIPASLGIGTGSQRAENDLKLVLGYMTQIQDKHMKINLAQRQSLVNASLYLEDQGKITHAQQDQVEKMAQIATSAQALRQTGLNAGNQMGQDFGTNFAAGVQNTGGNIRKATKLATDNAVSELQSLPKGARKAGAESMVSMASQLAAQGKIPLSAVRKLIQSINGQWPGMVDPAIANSKKLVSGVAKVMSGLQAAVSHPLQAISGLLNNFLAGLHIGGIDFGGIAKAGADTVSSLLDKLPIIGGGGGGGKGGKGGKKGQTGMAMIPDTGPLGDRHHVHAVLEKGEIFGVLNRNAASAVMAANAAAPRFAGGGVLEQAGIREVQIAGDVAEAVVKKAGGGPKLNRMIKFGKDEAAKGYPYVFGGGHGGFHGPYDCSGFVSAILHAGGFLSSPITTDGLKSFGMSGPGNQMTIGVRGTTGANAHTMMMTFPGGRSLGFESGGSGGGAHTTGSWDGSFPIKRHAPGMQKGGVMSGKLPFEPGAFDPHSAKFVGWGLQKGGVRYGQYLKHGDHWLHPHNPVNANEGHTLLWQAGMSDSDAGLLTPVLPDESGGVWNVRNKAGSGATGIWQVLGAVSPALNNLTNPIVNSINAAIKWNSNKGRESSQWPTLPGSGPSGHILRDEVFRKHGKVKPGRGIKPADDNKLKIGSLPIGSAAQAQLRHALKLARSIGVDADSFEDFGQRASQIEADVGGHPASWWYTEELKRLMALRNAVIQAHLILSTAIVKMNKMIAKMKKGAPRSKLKDLRDSASGKVQDIDSTLNDLQGAPIGVGKFDLLSKAPAAGVLGGRIFDVQMSLKQLGVDSTGTGSSTDEITQLKLDQALKALQRQQVDAAVTPILRSIPNMIQDIAGGAGFVGAFAKGGSPLRSGMALVGEDGPEIYKVRAGSQITPVAGTATAAAAPATWEVHVHGTIIPFEDHVGDVVEIRQRNDASSARRSLNG